MFLAKDTRFFFFCVLVVQEKPVCWKLKFLISNNGPAFWANKLTRTSIKDSGLEADGVTVEEIQVDEEVESGLRCEGVIEECRDRPPDLELLKQRVPLEHEPAGWQDAEATQQGKRYCGAEPVPTYER